MHGQLGAFDPDAEDWKSYVERMEFYFTANDINVEAKQRAILLSVCGAATYRMIKSIVAPAKPADKTFAQLVQALDDHYDPKPTVAVQRCIFNGRTRKPGETIS